MICGKKVGSAPLNSWMAESHQWQSRFGCPSLMGYVEHPRDLGITGGPLVNASEGFTDLRRKLRVHFPGQQLRLPQSMRLRRQILHHKEQRFFVKRQNPRGAVWNYVPDDFVPRVLVAVALHRSDPDRRSL